MLSQIRTIYYGVFFSFLLTVLPTVSSAQDPVDTETTPTTESTEEARRRPRRLQDVTNTAEEWTPGQGGDQERSLRRKLAMAAQAFDEGNLTAPVNASALKFYQDALEIDPGNQTAVDGVGQIVTRLLTRARELNSVGDRSGAEDLLQIVRNLRPNSSALAAAEADIYQRAEIDSGLAAGQLALDADDLPSALAAFQQVLTIEAENASAAAGLAAVSQAWAERVNEAIADGNFELAAEHATALAAIDPANPAIAEVDTARQAAEAEAQAELLQAAQLAFDGDDLDVAEQRLSEYAEVGGDAEQATQLLDAIERERRLAQYPAGSDFRDDNVAPLMVVVPAGQFEIGSPDTEEGRYGNEGPQQTIQIERPFALGQTEVTVGQFRQFVNATGYRTDAERAGESSIYDLDEGQLAKRSGVNWQNDYSGASADDGLPVVHVSHNDASAYASWLSEQTGEGYRLPSEAEFEYALRSGTSTPYWWGARRPQARTENLAGENDSEGEWSWRDQGFPGYRDGSWGPSPSGSFAANAFGLFDMGGNTLEWVADCYASNLNNIDLAGSAREQAGCERYVIKGGSWASSPRRSRSAQRTPGGASQTTCLLGFRVARDL